MSLVTHCATQTCRKPHIPTAAPVTPQVRESQPRTIVRDDSEFEELFDTPNFDDIASEFASQPTPPPQTPLANPTQSPISGSFGAAPLEQAEFPSECDDVGKETDLKPEWKLGPLEIPAPKPLPPGAVPASRNADVGMVGDDVSQSSLAAEWNVGAQGAGSLEPNEKLGFDPGVMVDINIDDVMGLKGGVSS